MPEKEKLNESQRHQEPHRDPWGQLLLRGGDLLGQLNPDGRLQVAYGAWSDLGYNAESLTGTPLADLLPRDDRAWFHSELRRFAHNPFPVRITLLDSANRATVWTFSFYAEGSILFFRAQPAAQSQPLASHWEGCPHGVLHLDTNSRIIDWNRAAAVLFGNSAADQVTLNDLPYDLRQALSQPISDEPLYLPSRGHWIILEQWPTAQGRLVLLRDVTEGQSERVQRERWLADARQFFEHSGVLFYTMDPVSGEAMFTGSLESGEASYRGADDYAAFLGTVHPDDVEQLLSGHRALGVFENELLLSYRVKSGDNWIEVSDSVVALSAGPGIGIRLIGTLGRSFESHPMSETPTFDFLDALPQAAAIADRRGAIIAFNLEWHNCGFIDPELIQRAVQRPNTAQPFPIASAPNAQLIANRMPDGNALLILDPGFDQVQFLSKLTHASRLTMLGEMSATLAHEVANPLAAMRGHAELLTLNSDPEVISAGESILKMADRTARLLKRFRTLSRRPTEETTPTSLPEIIKTSLDILETQIHRGEIEVHLELGDSSETAQLHATSLEQVLVNIIGNAVHALSERGSQRKLSITLSETDALWSISVRNNGPSIPADIAERIFDPFFTTKPAGTGTGLGLAICRTLVEAEGGELLLRNGTVEGCEFIMNLPKNKKDRSQPAA